MGVSERHVGRGGAAKGKEGRGSETNHSDLSRGVYALYGWEEETDVSRERTGVISPILTVTDETVPDPPSSGRLLFRWARSVEVVVSLTAN